jgi:hypothetical protein
MDDGQIQDQGASADADRAVVNGAASVSALRVSVPSAIADDRRMILQALHDAKLQLEYLDSRWPTGTTPSVIQRVEAALRDALPWATIELSLAYAQAIEARSDETRSGSAVGESAVPNGDAPTPSIEEEA